MVIFTDQFWHKIWQTTQNSKGLGAQETKLSLLRELLISGAALIQGLPEEPVVLAPLGRQKPQAALVSWKFFEILLQESGMCVKFARHLSTMKETEWGLFFNIRAFLGLEGIAGKRIFDSGGRGLDIWEIHSRNDIVSLLVYYVDK